LRLNPAKKLVDGPAQWLRDERTKTGHYESDALDAR
jgi:hypothetical protein